MSVVEEIQSAIKSKRAIIGYKESIKFIKTNLPKLIVMSNNIPENLRKEIEKNAKITNSRIEFFEGSSKELGMVCGKPFPVSTIVIK